MIRSDVVRTYRDIHSWVGIVCGLFLFIAFYAGAITMFEEPIRRWAATPIDLPDAPSLAESSGLIEAVLEQRPDARRNWRLHFETGPDAPARISWPAQAVDEGDHSSTPVIFGAAFDDNGKLVVKRVDSAPVAQFIDVLHQQVGLPLPHAWAMPIVGIIGLIYFLALISGVITLLPSLIKDLLQLRIGRNLKRMWLDVHNALGIFSLPFHMVMALTTIVFALHDGVYATQNVVVYDGDIGKQWAQMRPPPHDVPDDARLLEPDSLLTRIRDQAPGFTPTQVDYRSAPDGSVVARVQGYDPRFAMRGPTFGIVGVNPHSGEFVQTDYLPGHQSGWSAAISSFFSLHFGSYGGSPIRWGYFVLGLSGALMFYAGNLVWIESRRKRARQKAPHPQQAVSSRVMGSLTVGVAFGCIAGISATLAVAHVLPGLVDDPGAWHRYVFYLVFLSAIAWALKVGPGRGALHLAWIASALTAMLAVAGFASVPVQSGSTAWAIGIVALMGSGVLAYAAIRTARRTRSGPADSIWAAQAQYPARR